MKRHPISVKNPFCPKVSILLTNFFMQILKNFIMRNLFYAGNDEVEDQPVHQRNRISFFGCLKTIIPILTIMCLSSYKVYKLKTSLLVKCL